MSQLRHCCLLLSSSLFLTLAIQADAEDWNRFRGPNGSGVSADQGYAVQFSKDKNVVWRTVIRPGKSSPVLTGRFIFLTAADQDNLFTICLDRKTGRQLWERSVPHRNKVVANRLNHEAAVTPVTDGENVYVFFKSFGLISYDATGRTRWSVPLGPFVNSQGLASSPILIGQQVVLVADQWENSYIAAFDKSSGEMRWKVDREESEGWGTPLAFEPPRGEARIVTVSRGLLGLYRPVDGRRTASLPGQAITIVASPILDGNIVYAFGYGGDKLTPFSSRLDRLDKDKNGKLTSDEFGTDPILTNLARNAGNRDGTVSEDEWEMFAKKVMGPNCLVAVQLDGDKPRELWRYDKNFTSVIPSLLLYRKVLYIVRNGGILTTHDATTGAVIRQARLEGALGGYSSSPVAAEGRIWLASEEGKVTVITAGGEWETLAVNDMGEGIYATPALSKGTIYLRTEEAIYAIAQPRP